MWCVWLCNIYHINYVIFGLKYVGWAWRGLFWFLCWRTGRMVYHRYQLCAMGRGPHNEMPTRVYYNIIPDAFNLLLTYCVSFLLRVHRIASWPVSLVRLNWYCLVHATYILSTYRCICGKYGVGPDIMLFTRIIPLSLGRHHARRSIVLSCCREPHSSSVHVHRPGVVCRRGFSADCCYWCWPCIVAGVEYNTLQCSSVNRSESTCDLCWVYIVLQ